MTSNDTTPYYDADDRRCENCSYWDAEGRPIMGRDVFRKSLVELRQCMNPEMSPELARGDCGMLFTEDSHSCDFFDPSDTFLNERSAQAVDQDAINRSRQNSW